MKYDPLSQIFLKNKMIRHWLG